MYVIVWGGGGGGIKLSGARLIGKLGIADQTRAEYIMAKPAGSSESGTISFNLFCVTIDSDVQPRNFAGFSGAHGTSGYYCLIYTRR